MYTILYNYNSNFGRAIIKFAGINNLKIVD